MSGYENETCNGCQFRAVGFRMDPCCYCDRNALADSQDGRGDYFKPSLECRQVRALERIAKAIGVYGEGSYPCAYLNTHAEPED